MDSRIITGDIRKTLARMTGPMVFGILGMSIFNLVDTFFVGMLGTLSLAALAFTFPIVMVMNGLVLGVGIGVTSKVSKIAGSDDNSMLKSVVLNSMLLAIILSLILITLGFIFLDPVLVLLGAGEDTMPIIQSYMHIWLFGLPFVVIPMTGNSIIRAIGDTKTPGLVMFFGAIINAVLDPLLIFGVWIFPELSVAGAALATVISRFFTMCVALYVLFFREKLLRIKKPKLSLFKKDVLTILSVGIPDAFSKIVLPIGIGITTAMISSYGNSYIAGYGVASKVEMFLLMVCNALASVMIPFCGQNIGANRMDRVILARKYAFSFSLIFHFALYVIVFFAAPYISSIFDSTPAVVEISTLYLRVVALAYAFKSIILSDCAILNVLSHPMEAALVNVMQMYVLFIPISLLLNAWFGVVGIFSAISISLLLASLLSTWRVTHHLKPFKEK